MTLMMNQVPNCCVVVFVGISLIVSVEIIGHTPPQRPSDHLLDLGKPNTVETGDETNPLHKGFLQCAVNKLGPEFRHGTTAQAFDQLATAPDPRNTADIVGHGISGMECTGNGDSCAEDGDEVKMGNFNYDFWRPKASKIRSKFKRLSLVACEVGAGPDGADLLSKMADTTQMPVRGPDSFIFCVAGGIVFAEGGEWVEARPGQGAPKLHPLKNYVVKATDTFQFKLNGTYSRFPSSQVKVLSFEHRTIHQRTFQTLPPDSLSQLLRMIDFGSPFETAGRPAAIFTGTLRLQLTAEDRNIEKEFILFNDALIEDTVEQDVFYRVDRVQLSEYIAKFTK